MALANGSLCVTNSLKGFATLNQLHSSMKVLGIAHPNPLNPDVFPCNQTKAVNFGLAAGNTKSWYHVRSADPDVLQALLERLNSSAALVATSTPRPSVRSRMIACLSSTDVSLLLMSSAAPNFFEFV